MSAEVIEMESGRSQTTTATAVLIRRTPSEQTYLSRKRASTCPGARPRALAERSQKAATNDVCWRHFQGERRRQLAGTARCRAHSRRLSIFSFIVTDRG